MFQNKFQFKRDFTQRIVETYGRSIEESHRTERYMVLGEMVRDYASIHWKESKSIATQLKAKQMVYFSMEFLIGRLLTSNLMNLGIYEVVKDGLYDLGIDINELENMESDAGLGNGGLGRLAACFLDSLASLSLPGHGNCLRYEYGLFRQKIQNGFQIEVPDQWLRLGNVWEVRKPKHAVEVKFWGRVEMRKTLDGEMKFEHVDAEHVLAVPYDMPVVGKGTDMTNTLRLWSAEASDILPANKDFRQYISELREICQNVYPDDSTEHGRFLRLKQQYFFVAAGEATGEAAGALAGAVTGAVLVAAGEATGAGVGVASPQPGLLDQKCRDDPVNDLQHRGAQLRMSSQQDAQRDRKRQHPLAYRHPLR